MELALSRGAAYVLCALRAAGYEAYVVGGCVRDSLLGRRPGDWDVTTSALPEETKAVFSGAPVIGTGVRHGTVEFCSKMLEFMDLKSEIDTLLNEK